MSAWAQDAFNEAEPGLEVQSDDVATMNSPEPSIQVDEPTSSPEQTPTIVSGGTNPAQVSTGTPEPAPTIASEGAGQAQLSTPVAATISSTLTIASEGPEQATLATASTTEISSPPPVIATPPSSKAPSTTTPTTTSNPPKPQYAHFRNHQIPNPACGRRPVFLQRKVAPQGTTTRRLRKHPTGVRRPAGQWYYRKPQRAQQTRHPIQ